MPGGPRWVVTLLRADMNGRRQELLPGPDVVRQVERHRWAVAVRAAASRDTGCRAGGMRAQPMVLAGLETDEGVPGHRGLGERGGLLRGPGPEPPPPPCPGALGHGPR